LPEFEKSLYIDNAVLLKINPEQLIERYLSNHDVAIPLHSFRETTLDEFIAVSNLGYDDSSRLFEQLNHYSFFNPEVLEQKPLSTGIIFRRHNLPNVIEAFELWSSHVLRYSRRDQLSVILCLSALEDRLLKFDLDIMESDFHTWPHQTNRKQTSWLRDLYTSKMPSLALFRERQITIDDLTKSNELLKGQLAEYQEILSSINQNKNYESLQSEMQELSNNFNKIQNDNLELKTNLHKILSSKSWKLTSYYRSLFSLFKSN
jgi:hypothetical protein